MAEASIQENDVVAIDLENAQVDDEGNVSTFTYKVKPRDTIGGIASQFGTTAKNLRQINNLKDNAILKPGQVLTISVLE